MISLGLNVNWLFLEYTSHVSRVLKGTGESGFQERELCEPNGTIFSLSYKIFTLIQPLY